MIYKFILNSTTSLEDLIRALDKGGEGFLPVIDEKNKLIGVITDGDIRRAFLNKETNIENIINKKPLTAPISISKEKAIYILKKNHRRHLPLVDANNTLLEVIKLDNWNEVMRPNKVVIMAGGMGTRLGELTENIPKPMLPIGNKPILENLILSFKEKGFTEFYISVNYKAEIIKNYFKEGADFGVNIVYLEENKRLGTAGALSLISDQLKEAFFVINGDILSSVDYVEMLDFHKSNNAVASMGVAKKDYTIQFGVVNYTDNNEIETITEKPTHSFYVNAGIYILNPNVLSHIPKNEFFDMPTLFELLKKNNHKTVAFPIKDYWLDIGLKTDYFKAQDDLPSL